MEDQLVIPATAVAKEEVKAEVVETKEVKATEEVKAEAAKVEKQEVVAV